MYVSLSRRCLDLIDAPADLWVLAHALNGILNLRNGLKDSYSKEIA